MLTEQRRQEEMLSVGQLRGQGRIYVGLRKLGGRTEAQRGARGVGSWEAEDIGERAGVLCQWVGLVHNQSRLSPRHPKWAPKHHQE